MRGKRSPSLFSLAAMLALCLCAPGALAYNYAKSVTIDRSKIPNSCGATLASFPVLFSVTDAALKHTSSGGKVTDTGGDDIIFRGLDTTTCGGASSCTLDHQIEKYVSTTGELVAWVRVPALNTSAAGSDTVIYINYGDSTVTTPTQNPTGVWDANFKAVWHMNETDIDGGSGDIKDSTANANNGTTSGMSAGAQVAGKIDGSFNFDGSNDQVTVTASSSLNIRSAITMEAWVNATARDAKNWNDVIGKLQYDIYIDKNGKLCAYIDTNGGLYDACPGKLTMALGTWYHIAETYDAGSIKTYINGVQDGTATKGTLIDDSAGSNLLYGTCSFGSCIRWNGKLDELRISNTARSACWITASYNNQVWPDKAVTPSPDPSPTPSSGFFTLGAETQFLATMSSAANQSFTTGQASTTASDLTVTEAASATITTANEIRIRIPATFNMTWDPTVTTITPGGTASAKVSATLKAYEDSNRTAVVDVTANFAANDVLTITGLKFTSFTAISAADKLELVVGGAGGATTNEDDKTITIVAPAVGGFNAYETSTAGGAIAGAIKTKIAGSTVSLDMIALNAAKDAIATTFTGTVRVEVLNASNNSGGLDGNGCRSSWSVIQTLSPDPAFVSGDNGRKTISFTQANSYPEARLRITYPAGAPTVTGCSSDNFAIRPDTLASFAVTDTDWQTAGTGRALDLLTFAATTPIHKAGRPFSVRASALNAAGTPAVTTNYSGAPSATLSACSGAACTASFGTLTLATTFAAGQLASDVASYNNVGSFRVELVDSSFATVDAGDSSALEREIRSATIDVGRFVPDHLAVSLNTPEFGTHCGTFTYVGRTFDYTTPPVITVTGQDSSNNPTTLYAGAWFRISNSSLTGKSYTSATGTLDTSGIAGTDPVIDSAARTLGFSSGTGVLFTRTTPVAPFDAEISLAINVIDDDTVAYATNPARFGLTSAGDGIAFSSGKPMRFGRLRLQNAFGSEKNDLPIPMRTQYWTGTSFQTNLDDNCTALTSDRILFSDYQGGINAGNMAAINVDLGTGVFAAGVINFKLTKPSPAPAAAGAVTVTVDLTAAGLSHLKGNWGVTTYTVDPAARAAFGLYGSQPDNFIYFRENY